MSQSWHDNRGPGVYGIDHNPGFDFMRLVRWLSETDENNENLPFAAYLLPTMTIISSCCAIEAYVNMVGNNLDENWDDIFKGPSPIKDRISEIYNKIGKKADFGKGVLQEVLKLFKKRNDLMHPKYVNYEEAGDKHIQNIFDEIDAEFPADESRRIAESAIESILSDAGMSDLKEHWWVRSYSGTHGIDVN